MFKNFWVGCSFVLVVFGGLNLVGGINSSTLQEAVWVLITGSYFFECLHLILKNKLKAFYYLIPIFYLCLLIEWFLPIPSIFIRAFGVVAIGFGVYLMKWKLKADGIN